jgi:hypothetical protein
MCRDVAMRRVLVRVLLLTAVAAAIVFAVTRDVSVTARAAIVGAVLCGSAALIVELGATRDRPRGLPMLEGAVAAIGLLLLVWGAVAGSAALVVSGLTFVGLAALFLGAKVVLRRGGD